MLIKALILLLIFTLPSCKKNTEGVLIIADSDKIDKESADPTTVAQSAIGTLIFSDFSYIDNDLVPHNLLADEVWIQSAGRTLEIKIRKGVRFHDGREMTERDVAASFRKIMDTDKYMKERYGRLRVTIVDKLKVKISADEPISDWSAILNNIYVSPADLVGTGPYMINRWLENGVELAANNDYFEGPPKLKRVIYRYEPDERKRVNMLLRGEADLLVWLSPDMAGFLKKDERFYVNEWPYDFYSALFLNNESPLLRDKAVRLAVSMAIDRDKLIRKILNGGGTKISGPFPHHVSHPAINAGILDFRPREAARFLKDAGWRDSGDGILEKNGRKLIFRLYYNKGVDEFRKMADIIAQDLFEVGIGVEAVSSTLDEIDGNNFKSGDYDAILDAKASYDSVNLLTWRSSSLSNISRFNNREMDNLLDRLRETTDVEQKKEIYSKMQRVFEEEVPAVFLYNPVIYTAVNKKFKGAEKFVSSAYSVYKIKDWSIDEKSK